MGSEIEIINIDSDDMEEQQHTWCLRKLHDCHMDVWDYTAWCIGKMDVWQNGCLVALSCVNTTAR